MENKQNITQDETINVAEIDVSEDKSPEFLMQNLNKIAILPVDKWKHYVQYWEKENFESRRGYEAAVQQILKRVLETKNETKKCSEINKDLYPFAATCQVTPKNKSVISVSKPQVSQQLLRSTPGTSVTSVTSSSMNPSIKREKYSSDNDEPTQDKVTEEEHNTKKKYKYSGKERNGKKY
ncbi:uncharacterized protein LOC116842433 [Odontomachus brunneus]|uniref:uncharacterized protein LOC116842433 n=1 Tax=Odontomachus brunneus TaxID=486640 RepID=UPI0013F23E47|nr:uncharacterized protein LOC116842433 [Odontomachus brunneus]XP_032667568.1 uncharacterized protein LOC116842433 [Odontomachus brunneus]